MRWVLVIAFSIAAGATTWAGATTGEPNLRVEIGYALSTSDPEDADNELGRKYWDISPPVTVESSQRCTSAELTTRAETFFNGGRGFGSEQDGPVDAVVSGDGRHFEGRADGPGDAVAGETVRITATARCVTDSGRPASATAQREFELPVASCDVGPLRVGELERRVTAVDAHHEDQGERVLRPGFLITPGSELTVAPGGHVELGAPECNGFRVTLYEGDAVVGSYRNDGRGDSFSAERAVAEGDSLAGGVYVPRRATVWPVGFRCRACHATGPSSYEVRSSRDRVTVRVSRGAVLAGGPEGEPTLRVSAGYQASVLCSAVTCRAGHVRLFQPDEPWSTPPDGIVDRLARSVEGVSPPLGALAPPFSRVEAKRLPAAGGAPDQIVVGWSRQIRREGRDGFEEKSESGFLVWERVARSRWRVVYEQPSVLGGYKHFQVGDVTGDGHNDVLFDTSMGSGACGPRRLVAYAGRRTRELFERDFCEGHAQIVNGALRVEEGVGPCPHEIGSAHCRGGVRTTMLRWRGAKLASARRTVVCDLPHLDPAANCAERTRNTP